MDRRRDALPLGSGASCAARACQAEDQDRAGAPELDRCPQVGPEVVAVIVTAEPVRQTAAVSRRASVLDLCVSSVGVHRGAIAASYVARYAMTAHRLGKFPTAEEYAEDWAIKVRTAWNHRARMQAALGDSWRDVVMFVAAEMADLASERDAMRTPVPASLVVA
jgi:hypothetical protein